MKEEPADPGGAMPNGVEGHRRPERVPRRTLELPELIWILSSSCLAARLPWRDDNRNVRVTEPTPASDLNQFPRMEKIAAHFPTNRASPG